MQANGLMPQGLAQSQPVPEQAGPEFGEMVQASPEEQAQYDKFVAKGLEFIFDERMLPQIVDQLGGGGDPKAGLGKTAAMVTARIATAAEKAGEQLSPEVVLQGGREIFENLADVSEAAGVMDYTKDPDALEGAFFLAMDEFRLLMTQAGRIDQGAAQRDMDMLQSMDQDGKLEGIMRRLAAEGDPGGPQREQSAPQPEAKGLMPQ